MEKDFNYNYCLDEKDDFIFIKGNVPSLKNSKIKTSRGIFSSKTVKNYLRSLGIQSYSSSKKQVKKYVNKDNDFLLNENYFLTQLKTKPHIIGFHFVRNSKRNFDFNNANQIIADLLVAHGFIEDDDMSNFIPVPLKVNGKFYSIDKENPGVYLKIFN